MAGVTTLSATSGYRRHAAAAAAVTATSATSIAPIGAACGANAASPSTNTPRATPAMAYGRSGRMTEL
jgi:hypothetical protein